MPASHMPLRRTAAALVTLTLLALTPGLVAAQGGLLKKAKDKLAPKPDQTGPAPEFTANLLELTDARVDAWIKGVVAGGQAHSASGLSIAELNRRAEQAFQKRNEIMNAKGEERLAYEETIRTYDACVSKELNALQKDHENQAMAKMSDPAAIAQMQKYSQLSADRFAAGDTAGALKAQVEMMRAMGIDAKANR